jgi:DNA invertase Pin-like site-specific DNA recombinase
MLIGYIRVSKASQDTAYQRNAILEYAHKNKLVVDEFIELEISSRKTPVQRKLDVLLSKVKNGGIVIVSELSRLGRSISEVISTVNLLIEDGSRFVSIKEGIDIKDRHSMQSKVMITMFSLVADLERDLISQRTKEALATKKAEGVVLGRPKGPGKSKLEKHEEQIKEFIEKKVSMLSISKILGVSYSTLFNYIKKRGLKASKVA